MHHSKHIVDTSDLMGMWLGVDQTLLNTQETSASSSPFPQLHPSTILLPTFPLNFQSEGQILPFCTHWTTSSLRGYKWKLHTLESHHWFYSLVAAQGFSQCLQLSGSTSGTKVLPDTAQALKPVEWLLEYACFGELGSSPSTFRAFPSSFQLG